jgi:hypothetical protein
MQHVGRVDVFQPAQRLVDKALKVGVAQGLAGPDLSSHHAKRPLEVSPFAPFLGLFRWKKKQREQEREKEQGRKGGRKRGRKAGREERSGGERKETHDSMQIRLHKLLVQVHLVETSRPGVLDDVQVVEAGDLPTPNPQERKGKEREARQRAAGESERSKRASLPACEAARASMQQRDKRERRWGRTGGTYVLVPPKVVQELDLPQTPLGEDLLGEDVCDLTQTTNDTQQESTRCCLPTRGRERERERRGVGGGRTVPS